MHNIRAARKACCKTRYLVPFLSFLSLANLFSICVNLSIAMVAMVKKPVADASRNQSLCPELNSISNNYNISKEGDELFGISPEGKKAPTGEKGEFNWDPTMQGHLLSAFFYGYFLSSVGAGLIATAYGAKWVLGYGVLMAGVVTLFLPLATRWSPWAFFAGRLIIGVGSGVCLPTIHTLIGKWVPEKERSIQNTLIYNGIVVGNVLTLTLSGQLINTGFLGGWPAVFYITGSFACVWFVFWAWLVYESPQDHPNISQEEMDEIMGGKKPKTEKGKIPWRSIATSVPFLALCVTHFCNNWGFSTLLTNVPTYLAQVLHVELRENGMLSAIPYVTSFVFASISCIAVDKLRSQGVFPITTLRKLANSVAFFLPGICLFIIPFLGCAPVCIITLLALTSGFNGFKLSGFCVTHVDMSPEFAGLLMSGTSTFGNFAGVMGPLVAGSIQKKYQNTMQAWTYVFVLTGIIYITGGIVYDLFCSAKLQSWAEGILPSQEDPEHNTDLNSNAENTDSEDNTDYEPKSSDLDIWTCDTDSENTEIPTAYNDTKTR